MRLLSICCALAAPAHALTTASSPAGAAHVSAFLRPRVHLSRRPRTTFAGPSMAVDPQALDSSAIAASTALLANSGAVEAVGPVLIAQMSVCAGLLGSGFALDAFFEVDEPKEPGAEGPDIYRDSLLRYLGYANEVGEAFRPLVPVVVVYVSYVLAIAYILADTVDKGRKGAAVPGDGGAIRGTLGAVDTFCWQMLASVIFPSFCINRLVLLLNSLQADGSLPDLLQAGWVPTAAGLIAIPLIILPLDTLAHFTLNQSFRRVSKSVMEA